jgi:hypothetical protein
MSFAALLAELFYIKTTWLKCVAHMLRKQVDRLKQKGVSPNNHAKKERRINSDRFRWKRINKYTSKEIVSIMRQRRHLIYKVSLPLSRVPTRSSYGTHTCSRYMNI